jgi:hypothetical protein
MNLMEKLRIGELTIVSWITLDHLRSCCAKEIDFSAEVEAD